MRRRLLTVMKRLPAITLLLVGLSFYPVQSNRAVAESGTLSAAKGVPGIPDSTFMTTRRIDPAGPLFGSEEHRTKKNRYQEEWRAVLHRMEGIAEGYDACVEKPTACRNTVQRVWRRLAQTVGGATSQVKLDRINRFFNQTDYSTDRDNYGRKEYWATPEEFQSRAGDCEDFAIAKYYALRALGYSAKNLRIVALRDRIEGNGHAVLAVYEDNNIFILDNRSDIVFSHAKYRHYEPTYSMNEVSAWAHEAHQKAQAN